MPKKDVIDKAFNLDALTRTNPDIAKIVKQGSTQAENAVRDFAAAETADIKKALTDAAKLAPGPAAARKQEISAWGRLNEGCDGTVCATACGIGCVGACFFAPPLVGFGAAGGTAGGAGTSNATSYTSVVLRQ